MLNDYILRLEKIKDVVGQQRLNNIKKQRLKKELEKLKRLIDKEYRYSEIKASIIMPVKD